MRYMDIEYPYREDAVKFAERFVEWVCKRFFKKRGSLLDVGCGRGYYLKAFKKMDFKVKGCDIEAISSKISRVNLEKGKLPYPNKKFDYIFCKSIIEHLKDPTNMLSEILRVLKVKGRMLILTDDWKKCYKNFWDDFSHQRPYTKRSLKMVLELNGFRIIKIDDFRHPPYVWRLKKIGHKAFDIWWYKPAQIYAIVERAR